MIKLKEDSAAMALIRSRRSVFPKEFDDGLVSKEEIEGILEAARWAPTHKSTEPWRFKVFMNASKFNLAEQQVEALIAAAGASETTEQKATKFRFIAQQSQAIVAVIMLRDPLKRLPANEEEWAVACAIQNVHIVAASQNIGMYWSTGASTNSPAIRALLNLSPDDLHMGWLYLGRFLGQKHLLKDRKPLDEIVEWIEE